MAAHSSVEKLTHPPKFIVDGLNSLQKKWKYDMDSLIELKRGTGKTYTESKKYWVKNGLRIVGVVGIALMGWACSKYSEIRATLTSTPVPTLAPCPEGHEILTVSEPGILCKLPNGAEAVYRPNIIPQSGFLYTETPASVTETLAPTATKEATATPKPVDPDTKIFNRNDVVTSDANTDLIFSTDKSVTFNAGTSSKFVTVVISSGNLKIGDQIFNAVGEQIKIKGADVYNVKGEKIATLPTGGLTMGVDGTQIIVRKLSTQVVPPQPTQGEITKAPEVNDGRPAFLNGIILPRGTWGRQPLGYSGMFYEDLGGGFFSKITAYTLPSVAEGAVLPDGTSPNVGKMFVKLTSNDANGFNDAKAAVINDLKRYAKETWGKDPDNLSYRIIVDVGSNGHLQGMSYEVIIK